VGLAINVTRDTFLYHRPVAVAFLVGWVGVVGVSREGASDLDGAVVGNGAGLWGATEPPEPWDGAVD
jgi:hypothetical protein